MLAAGYSSPMVLLVGVDALTPQMVTPQLTPAIHHLSACGVQAPLTPSYPTHSLPNLYTIVTVSHHNVIVLIL